MRRQLSRKGSSLRFGGRKPVISQQPSDDRTNDHYATGQIPALFGWVEPQEQSRRGRYLASLTESSLLKR